MLKIVTNYVPRDVVNGYEMDPKILFDEFDIDVNDPELDEDKIADLCNMQFVQFRGVWYNLEDFITTSPGPWGPTGPSGPICLLTSETWS